MITLVNINKCRRNVILWVMYFNDSGRKEERERRAIVFGGEGGRYFDYDYCGRTHNEKGILLYTIIIPIEMWAINKDMALNSAKRMMITLRAGHKPLSPVPSIRPPAMCLGDGSKHCQVWE